MATITIYGVSGALGTIEGPNSSNYTTIHDASTGQSAYASSGNIQNEVWVGAYLIMRAPMIFDSSGIPAGATINSATLYIYPTGGTRSGDGSYARIVSFTGSGTTIANADYLYTKYGTVNGGETILSSLTAGAYRAIAFNATGLAYIIAGGTTKFALRDTGDINSTVPGGINARLSFEGVAGGNPPKIVIDYTAAVCAISGAVTLSGVAVSGATVRCIRQSDNVAIAEQTTDVDGLYLFEDLEETELYHLAIEYETGGVKYNALSLWDISPVQV